MKCSTIFIRGTKFHYFVAQLCIVAHFFYCFFVLFVIPEYNEVKHPKKAWHNSNLWHKILFFDKNVAQYIFVAQKHEKCATKYRCSTKYSYKKRGTKQKRSTKFFKIIIISD